MDKPITKAVVLEAFQDAMESAHGYRPQVFATGVLVNSRDADRFEGYQLAIAAAQQPDHLVDANKMVAQQQGQAVACPYRTTCTCLGACAFGWPGNGATAPPSAPVGVEAALEFRRLRYQADRLDSFGMGGAAENIREAADKLERLAQQPAAVDEVEGLKRLVRHLAGNPDFDFVAALATQHQEPTT